MDKGSGCCIQFDLGSSVPRGSLQGKLPQSHLQVHAGHNIFLAGTYHSPVVLYRPGKILSNKTYG